jgi:hypothetical protein
MAAPRRWEHGDGRVVVLIPQLADMKNAKSGVLPIDAYRARYEAKLQRELNMGHLDPGVLYTTAGRGTAVTNGDVLCCSCSRDAAARGECHRAWAARFLVLAGWRVVLDGEEFPEPEATLSYPGGYDAD